MKKNPLIEFGNTPIQTSTLACCFPAYSSPMEKIRSLERDEQIIRLKKGMYVVSDDVSDKPINLCLCANHIYGPSYVSLQWALRWYGLIPEKVYMLTSVTTKRTRTFENKLGTFSYIQVPRTYFPIGVKTQEEGETTYLLATPEKALCDTILHDNYVPSLSVIGLREYLEQDLRFNMDALTDFDINVIEECASHGRKQNIFRNLIKLIKQ
jgi:predicted transcriptional regulator of viral defense system